MIPKVIHLCWFSGESYPVEIQVCLDSWKRILPDWRIRVWDRKAAEAIGCRYINEALAAKKWAFAADAVRFYAVYQEGGLYMDSDIFLRKRFDEFIPEHGCATFHERLNREQRQWGLQAAFFMGEAGNEFCRQVYAYYASRPFVKEDGSFDMTISPYVMRDVARGFGLENRDTEQHLDGLTLYPTYHLSPANRYEHHPDAFGVHRIYGSWRERKWGRRLELRLKHWLFVLRYAQEPKNQGLHSRGYKLGRSAKISENSLRSNTEISSRSTPQFASRLLR